MAYLLLDESGDLGFSSKKGSTQFFIITVVFTESKRPLEKIARRVYTTLRHQYRKFGVLHANKEMPSTRRRLLEELNKTDASILVIVLNKANVYTHLQDEKSVLYNYVANMLLDRLFKKRPISVRNPITLIASRRETNQFLNQNFRDYLSRQTHNSHKIQLRIEIAVPSKEKSLQVADFASWAIFRKYEFEDTTYYDLIKDKIVQESTLFQ